MNTDSALKAFSSLSQDTRLRALRILVAHGREGMAAGQLGKQLGIPHNTLSFHLTHLCAAGLAKSRNHGRSVIYSANLDALQALVRFLLKDCCLLDKSTCSGVEQLMKACAC